MNLAGTSLVAAIPAAFLGYLMLMAVINSMDAMPTMLKVMAILLLLVAAVMLLFPAYIMIYFSSGAASAKAPKTTPDETSALPSQDAAEDLSGEFDELDGDAETEAAEDLDDEFGKDIEETSAFNFDESDEFASDDEFEFDEEDEDR